jgi:hypothetical protein
MEVSRGEFGPWISEYFLSYSELHVNELSAHSPGKAVFAAQKFI